MRSLVTDCTIRSFTSSDQEAVRQLVLDGLGEHFGAIDAPRNPDLDDIMANYNARGGLFVVAECTGALVATGALIEETAGIGRLVRVSVDPRYRRRGLARAIVAHLVETARHRGYRRLLVETNDDWTDAIALYHACGFVAEGRRDDEAHFSLDLG